MTALLLVELSDRITTAFNVAVSRISARQGMQPVSHSIDAPHPKNRFGMPGLPILILVLILRLSLASLAHGADGASLGSENPRLLGDFPMSSYGAPVPVSLTVNKKDYVFVIDTGAAYTVFDVSLRPLLGKSIGAPVHVRRPIAADQLYKAPALRIGTHQLRGAEQVACYDLSDVRAITSHEFAGILGMDVLTHYVLELDSDERRIRLWHDMPTSRGKRIRMDLRSKVPSVTAEIDGRPLTFIVDTGCVLNGAGMLDAKQFKAMRDANRLALRAPIGDQQVGRLLGQFRLSGRTHESLLFTEGFANILGLGYLSRYVTVFDFRRGSLTMSPSHRYSTYDKAQDLSGLELQYTDGQVRVASVCEHSPAANAGLKPGDVLGGIDIRPSASYTFNAIQDILATPNQVVTLGVVRWPYKRPYTIRLRLGDRPDFKGLFRFL